MFLYVSAIYIIVSRYLLAVFRVPFSVVEIDLSDEEIESNQQAEVVDNERSPFESLLVVDEETVEDRTVSVDIT